MTNQITVYQNTWASTSENVFSNKIQIISVGINPSLAEHTCPVVANSVDPDQLASEDANWSGSALFVIKYVNFYQKSRSSNLIGWKLEVGMAS